MKTPAPGNDQQLHCRLLIAVFTGNYSWLYHQVVATRFKNSQKMALRYALIWLKRCDIRGDIQNVLFGQILNDRTHQKAAGSDSGEMLEIVQLTPQIAGRASRKRGKLVGALQTFAVAGCAGYGFTFAATRNQRFAFLQAPDGYIGDESGAGPSYRPGLVDVHRFPQNADT